MNRHQAPDEDHRDPLDRVIDDGLTWNFVDYLNHHANDPWCQRLAGFYTAKNTDSKAWTELLTATDAEHRPTQRVALLLLVIRTVSVCVGRVDLPDWLPAAILDRVTVVEASLSDRKARLATMMVRYHVAELVQDQDLGRRILVEALDLRAGNVGLQSLAMARIMIEALSGTGCRLGAAWDHLAGRTSSLDRRLVGLRFIDDVCAGRWSEAVKRLPNLKAMQVAITGTIALHETFLYIAQAILAGGRDRSAMQRVIEARFASLNQANDMDWARRDSLRLLGLVHGDTQLAEEILAEGPYNVTTSSCISASIGLRAAALLKRLDVLEHFLAERRRRSILGPTDLFFAAKLALLRDRHGGQTRLAQAFAEAGRFDARGRVLFEAVSGPDLPLITVIDALAPIGQPDLGLPSEASGGLLGSSPAIREVRRLVQAYALSSLPVLIIGETGTGKELTARALHECSPRRAHPLVIANCGAITDSLLEAELFGHAAGSFSGAGGARPGLVEEAGEGTLVLDEIGEASLHLQAALLRLIDRGEYRVVGSASLRRARCRIVCATNRDLSGSIRDRHFRSDLYHRISTLRIELAPLRERPEDIGAIAVAALNQASEHQATLTLAAVQRLRQHDWPGNVRELIAVMQRLCVADPGRSAIDAPDIDSILSTEASTQAESVATPATSAGPSLGPSWLSRRESLLTLFQQHQRLTRADICRLLSISGSTATLDLKDLLDRGLIEKIEPNLAPRSHYFILKPVTSPAGEHTRAP